jgi:hypothetical protein
LFAEGYHLGLEDRLARRWDKVGAGTFVDIVGTRDAVTQFVPSAISLCCSRIKPASA